MQVCISLQTDNHASTPTTQVVPHQMLPKCRSWRCLVCTLAAILQRPGTTPWILLLITTHRYHYKRYHCKRVARVLTKKMHHCCHLSNKVEILNIYSMYLQWANRCPPKLPLPMGDPGPQPNTRFLGHIQVHILNGILISSAILAQLMVVTKKETDRQTDTHARAHARTHAHTHAHTHTLTHTHRPCYICSNRPHLMLCVAMWLNYTPERCGTMLETIILKNVQLVQQNFRPPPVLWVRNTGGAFNFCTIEPFVPSVLWHLFVGRQERHPACKKNRVVGCLRGYLPGAMCRLAYGSADATATHCLLLQ